MNNVEVMEEAEKKSEREEESKAENKKERGQINNSLEENAVSTEEIEVSQEIGKKTGWKDLRKCWIQSLSGSEGDGL